MDTHSWSFDDNSNELNKILQEIDSEEDDDSTHGDPARLGISSSLISGSLQRRAAPRSKIQMCVVYVNARVACCYYEPDMKCLFYLKDLQETDNFTLVDLLIEDVRPQMLITSEKSEQRFLNYLRIRLEQSHGYEFNSQLDPAEAFKSLKILPSSHFDYESAKQQIFSLDTLNEMPPNMSERDKIIYFGALFDLECRQGVSCVGALLKFLDMASSNVERQARRFETFYKGGQLPNEIFSVRPIKLDKLLLLDTNTFKSLEIFSEVDYSCAFKQTYSASSANFRTCLNDKHTETLYALYLNKISTRAGIAKLRSFMLKPTRDVNILSARHKLIDFFVDNRNQTLTRFVQTCLKSCRYIAPIMRRMKTSKCSLADWKRLLATTNSFLQIAHTGRVITERLQLRQQHDPFSTSFSTSQVDQHSEISTEDDLFHRAITRGYAKRFESLLGILTETINFKQSKADKNVVVHSSVYRELERKREIFQRLPEFLTKVAREEAHKFDLNHFSIIYVPMLGFLAKMTNQAILEYVNNRNDWEDNFSLPCAADESFNSFSYSSTRNQAATAPASTAASRNNTQSNEIETARVRFGRANPTFRFIYTAQDASYYKIERCLELDDQIGDIAVDIGDIEMNILDNLQGEFVRYSHIYADMSDVCAELDCLLAFAHVAAENQLVKPELVLAQRDGPSFLQAENVRHLLVELQLESSSLFVPNCVETGSPDEFDPNINKIKVITGPNESGKTIYIKQVGLLVYMSMIGSYVAASRAIVGDFDRIFTRLSSNECISLQLSSFSIDLKQLTDALNGATHRSLVLVDELGRGTDFADGQALVAATIRFLIGPRFESPAQSPHFLLVTHFYEILHSSAVLFGQRMNRLKFLSFESAVKCDESTRILEFLFKLKEGITSSSHALNVAKRLGFPETVLNRAEELYRAIQKEIYKPSDEMSNEADELGSVSRSEEESIGAQSVSASGTSLATIAASNPPLFKPSSFYERQKEIVREALKLNAQIAEQSEESQKEIKKTLWTEFLKKNF